MSYLATGCILRALRVARVALPALAAAILVYGPAIAALPCAHFSVSVINDPPNGRLTVNPPQFVIALRACEDCGFKWNLQRSTTQSSAVHFVRESSVWDTACHNAQSMQTKHPVHMVGGEATEYFVFSARGTGRASLTFDLIAPGRSAPSADPNSVRTYDVVVGPRTRVTPVYK